MSDDFDDTLDDLIGGAPRSVTRAPVEFKPVTERVFTETCTKCGGSGSWRGRGTCFACKGQGTFQFKTSRQDREKARDARQDKKVRDRTAWAEEHKAELAWLQAAAKRNAERGGTFGFPQSMLDAIVQWGSLTDGQLAAVQKLILKDEAFIAKRQADAQTRQDTAPVCDASRIAQAFKHAQEAAVAGGDEGVLFLKLRLDTFAFSPDKTGNGDIWVKEGSDWLGKIVAGKFNRFRKCSDEQQARILVVAADPAAAAKAFGLRFKSCSCCGRTLTNAESRELGIGPWCAKRWGF